MYESSTFGIWNADRLFWYLYQLDHRQIESQQFHVFGLLHVTHHNLHIHTSIHTNLGIGFRDCTSRQNVSFRAGSRFDRRAISDGKEEQVNVFNSTNNVRPPLRHRTACIQVLLCPVCTFVGIRSRSSLSTGESIRGKNVNVSSSVGRWVGSVRNAVVYYDECGKLALSNAHMCTYHGMCKYLCACVCIWIWKKTNTRFSKKDASRTHIVVRWSG